jgi:hypothetical protein
MFRIENGKIAEHWHQAMKHRVRKRFSRHSPTRRVIAGATAFGLTRLQRALLQERA